MSMPSTSPPTKAPVLIASSKDSIGSALSHPIIQACKSALSSRDIFTIALSGGSLPNFLRALPTAFDAAGVNPQWNKWHVILADERCVVSTHEDSNLGAVRQHFTDGVAIPKDQVYGIDETLLSEGSEAVARSYSDNVVKPLLDRSDGMLDCVVLGFGPDGHTCSLFPNHKLLTEQTLLVSHIDDSPKPPPSRITLTFPVLNKLSRCVIFCGAGASKSPILRDVFGNAILAENDEMRRLGARKLVVELKDPAPYPCAMVRPVEEDSLIWVVDEDAARDGILMKE
ncbi:hypothetical protein ACHAWO_013266 [Cyclotella atomus]|uniref:6-phosphogluconolactonase n=1 Tax=Cyclotella atomus TaxID=382360 RepID=A0ABD3QJT9_9STRA